MADAVIFATLENPDTSHGGCFICQAVANLGDADQRKSRLVLWETPHSIVIMNKFPYTNGHLLVAPRAHVAELVDLSDEANHRHAIANPGSRAIAQEGDESAGFLISASTSAGVLALDSPDTFTNTSSPAGRGDVNFMSVVGHVRIVPQSNGTVVRRTARGNLTEG